MLGEIAGGLKMAAVGQIEWGGGQEI